MPELESNNPSSNYDTTINVIGGLSDCDIIYSAIDGFFTQGDAIRDLASTRNDFQLRTERSKIRVELAVRRSFLEFYNQDHKDLIQALFQHKLSLPEKELILFCEMNL